MKRIARLQLPLHVLQQVDDLRLHRNVERRHRLVADQDARLHRDSAGNRDALALAAGERARIAGHVIGIEPDQLRRISATRSRRAAAVGSSRWTRSPSPTNSATVMRGLRLP